LKGLWGFQAARYQSLSRRTDRSSFPPWIPTLSSFPLYQHPRVKIHCLDLPPRPKPCETIQTNNSPLTLPLESQLYTPFRTMVEQLVGITSPFLRPLCPGATQYRFSPFPRIISHTHISVKTLGLNTDPLPLAPLFFVSSIYQQMGSQTPQRSPIPSVYPADLGSPPH